MKNVPNENNEKKIGKRRPFWLLIPVFFVLLIFILFRFVFILGYVPTESMEPTINKESMVFGIRIYGELDVGDIVIFDKDGELMVKRIVAKGGDTITVDEIVYNVPDGCYFMLGDNKNNSFDSRYWENPYIAEEKIIAKVILK